MSGAPGDSDPQFAKRLSLKQKKLLSQLKTVESQLGDGQTNQAARFDSGTVSRVLEVTNLKAQKKRLHNEIAQFVL